MNTVDGRTVFDSVRYQSEPKKKTSSKGGLLRSARNKRSSSPMPGSSSSASKRSRRSCVSSPQPTTATASSASPSQPSTSSEDASFWICTSVEGSEFKFKFTRFSKNDFAAKMAEALERFPEQGEEQLLEQDEQTHCNEENQDTSSPTLLPLRCSICQTEASTIHYRNRKPLLDVLKYAFQKHITEDMSRTESKSFEVCEICQRRINFSKCTSAEYLLKDLAAALQLAKRSSTEVKATMTAELQAMTMTELETRKKHLEARRAELEASLEEARRTEPKHIDIEAITADLGCIATQLEDTLRELEARRRTELEAASPSASHVSDVSDSASPCRASHSHSSDVAGAASPCPDTLSSSPESPVTAAFSDLPSLIPTLSPILPSFSPALPEPSLTLGGGGAGRD